MKRFVHILAVVIFCCVGFTTAQREAAEVTIKAIPFYIDESEVVGASKVGSMAEMVEVDGAKTVDVYVAPDVATVVFLFGPESEFVAMDVVIAGFKETLYFNAFNSAKADVRTTFGLLGIPNHLSVELYKRIDSHPQFPELVKEYADAKKVPDTDSTTTLSVDIATDLARQLRAELEARE